MSNLKTVRVTVMYPQTFVMEVDGNKTIEEQQEQIKKYADYLMQASPPKPFIHDCNYAELLN